MPKVSVIIPVYGVEKYIERCARSLFEQTLDDIEYLFIDDCTPDRSIVLLEQIIEKYLPRFAREKKIVRIEKLSANSGQAAVRRYGIQLATGDYIIHCDSDDWIDVTMYEKMYNKAVREKLDIVICDYYRSDGINHHLFNSVRCVYKECDYMSALLSGKVSTAVWNKLVKSELYKLKELIPPICNMWEDYVYTSQLFYYAKSIDYINEPLYYYYYNENSICNSVIEKRIEQIKINSDLIFSFLKGKKLTDKYSDELIYFKYYCRSELDSLVANRKYLKMWKNIFPEINRSFYFAKNITIHDKIKFFFIYLGLYPLILKHCRKNG